MQYSIKYSRIYNIESGSTATEPHSGTESHERFRVQGLGFRVQDWLRACGGLVQPGSGPAGAHAVAS